MRRWARWIPIAILVAGVGLAVSPTGRRWGEAVVLLADVFRVGREPPAEDGAGAAVILPYSGPAGAARVADLYCDEGAPAGARLLLAHGLVETGRRDLRLVSLGRALARRRFLVMVPDFPGMRALRASTADVAEMRAALDALGGIAGCSRGRPLTGPSMPTGAVGISYAAGPLLLALDRRPPGADFAVLFGGYYDLAEVILFLTTGRHRDAGLEEDSEILPRGRWILLQSNARSIADGEDARRLTDIARRRLDDPGAEIGDLAASLGLEARAVLDLLTNEDPDRFDALFRSAGESLRAEIEGLSPSKSLRRPLEVDLYLLHGRSDVVIPYTQSLKMRRLLRTNGAVRLVMVGGFRHARAAESVGEGWIASVLRHPADSAGLLSVLSEILARRRPSASSDRDDGAAPQ